MMPRYIDDNLKRLAYRIFAGNVYIYLYIYRYMDREERLKRYERYKAFRFIVLSSFFVAKKNCY